MHKSYLKIAWRNLIGQKAVTVINILGLAIGISACLIIYLLIHFEFSYDTFHADKGRIYRIVSVIDNPRGDKNYLPQVPYAAALTIRREFTGIEKMANFFSYSASVTVPELNQASRKFRETYPSETIIPESSYFDIFKYEWLEGNAATALDQPFRVVLTESRARLYFGLIPLGEIMGRELIYGDSLYVTVSGIVKDWNHQSDLIFKEFISFGTIKSSFLKDLTDFEMVTRPDSWERPDYSQNFVKLAKGTTPARFDEQTASMIKEHMTHKEDWGKARITLQPLPDIHFNSNYEDFYSRRAHLPTLYILMAIAVFILLIASINFINLSTAQSLRRAKEIGIRKLLGSNRASLVLQFLTETMVLTCLAEVLSLLIAYPVLHIFRDFIPKDLGLNLTDSFTWIFLLCTILVTSLLAGLYPALVLSSYLPIRSLQARGTATQKGYFRKGLIVFQFTISLVFIISTMVVGGQTHYLLNKDMGFTKDAIIGIQTSNNYATNTINILAERIRQLPGVRMVSACRSAPMVDNSQLEENILQLKDKPTQKLECSERVGDEYYVPLFGLKIVAGRNFIPPHDDTVGLVPAHSPGYVIASKHTEILINETCARQLGFKTPEEAIGHLVGTPVPGYPIIEGPIVGVVADFHAQSLFSQIRPTYLYGSKNLWFGGVQVKLNMQNKNIIQLSSTLAAIEKSWKALYTDESFEYQFLDESIARFYDKEKKTAQITSAAMIIAIFVSCMGLLGLVTFTSEQRRKEIGIRKVLGASVSGIVAMLSKDFLKLVGLSIVIASPIAYYFLQRWLQDFAYRISISWWIFVLAGLSAILIAMITISFHAIKAALASPVENLRME